MSKLYIMTVVMTDGSKFVSATAITAEQAIEASKSLPPNTLHSSVVEVQEDE